MTEFILHERLNHDSIWITDWSLSQVRLMNDQNYLWLILVPQRPNISELHELAATDHVLLMQEIAHASTVLKNFARADKINVAALGNIVSQLHVHIIARHVNDVAWPKPIWGVATTKLYDTELLHTTVDELRHCLGCL